MKQDNEIDDDYILSHRENGREFDEISKEELYDMVYHDAITGYYNWNHMWKILDPRIPKDFKFCFVHFDIKDFKMINDIYGHKTANSLLRMICEQMSKQDWIIRSCRCDNDNFAFMMKSYDDELELYLTLSKFFE